VTRRPTRHPRAFTLVEAIATMVVLSVLAGLSWRLVLTGVTQAVRASDRLGLSGELSSALERAASEVRHIPAKAGVSPAVSSITSVTPASLAWLGPLGGPVSLTLNSGELVLTEGWVSTTLARDVTAFGVRTFDHANAPLATTLNGAACEAVRRVELTLTASRAGVTETLRTRVFLRACSPGS
jgi:prepilin-type N-terminal cleavage/methylation domain-containing protein